MEMNTRNIWEAAKNELIEYVILLGFSRELGESMAIRLGSLKAIDLMAAFLYRVEPSTEDLIISEMTSICPRVRALILPRTVGPTLIRAGIPQNSRRYFAAISQIFRRYSADISQVLPPCFSRPRFPRKENAVF